ncbi:histidine phosphatase family protein [Novosphingobium sp.]|uniref:histidine phosphatase family protein n=1 Tax=Novosphingobium sp. TaxID=1874826 RepID=UPI00163D55D4|nr:histidine phosphatase family protein [Novosphingobium sp.]
MATTLLLICIAATAPARHGGFAGPEEPLDEGGLRDAARTALNDRFRDSTFTSPALAAAETAGAMGITGRTEPALADIDHGRWSGRAFAQVHEEEPGAFSAWIADPLGGAPGGESMETARQRIGRWMDEIARHGGPACGITHPMIVRAALSHALCLPLSTTLAIDIAPLSHTVFSFSGRWRLQSLGLAGGLAGSGLPG